MCGKFTQMASWAEVVAFSAPFAAVPEGEPLQFATPMRFAHVLRLDAQGRREVVPMRWGFADKKAGAPDRPKHMHARAETIDERATFADAFAHRRGILLVATFNEGEELPSGKTRQWVIAPKDRKPLAIAVIWEEWAKPDGAGGEERLATFVMATTPANALVSKITDRMPAMLPPDAWPAWLGETGASLGDLKALLATLEDAGAWEMAPQEKPSKRGKAADKPSGQGDLLG
jgi:putative SOS response-associated peptidase YedK